MRACMCVCMRVELFVDSLLAIRLLPLVLKTSDVCLLAFESKLVPYVMRWHEILRSSLVTILKNSASSSCYRNVVPCNSCTFHLRPCMSLKVLQEARNVLLNGMVHLRENT